ncbi:MAG: hypothetical protein CM1200mP6_09620 [Anaerolineaceae bacterium]|nr:MAG: hypothetical protein CM1200mP6_09620 [Anaerolineaceae bacterium]
MTSSIRRNNNNISSMVINGTILSAILTAIIAVTAVRLTGFEIVGSTVAFAYPWRLVEPTVMSQLLLGWDMSSTTFLSGE